MSTESAAGQHNYFVERKAELVEQENQQQLELERLAETIRAFMATMQERVTNIDASSKARETWADCALAHADGIDPIINPVFLNSRK